MEAFELDSRLAADCIPLTEHDGNLVLLMDNADYPWLIIVPRTAETEFHRLEYGVQQRVLDLVNRLAAFIEERFDVDKLNIATIGNVVAQLHVHVVGRRRSDPAWPGVVWGATKTRGYERAAVERIRRQLEQSLRRHS